MTKYLTPEGLEKLKKELDNLKNVKRKEVSEKISFSASFGDLKENAAYDTAKEEQGFIEGRIAELEQVLNQAKVLKKNVGGMVQLGSIVLVSCYNKKERFQIVEPEEADIDKGKISYKSPLGGVLFGKRKGAKVEIEAPDGKIGYQIIEIA
ncbi:MAG: transcription elongation factor GreA [Candidatus Nealsonbacteria bacterium]|nr:transcription elongation factor GreA [Candidatus Nealsonbacteria bacterium]